METTTPYNALPTIPPGTEVAFVLRGAAAMQKISTATGVPIPVMAIWYHAGTLVAEDVDHYVIRLEVEERTAAMRINKADVLMIGEVGKVTAVRPLIHR